MQKNITVDSALIKKYDHTVPRYTSYPTAPYFHSEFSNEEYCQHAETSNQVLLPRDLSLYIHIPFCHSLCYFCGCNKVITQSNHRKVEQYIDALLKEVRLRAALFDDDRRVTQIHFGGGTPNFLNIEQLTEILDEIATNFHLDLPSRLEISIEIDPRAIQTEDMNALSEAGFNRFSIGVQDFSRKVQHAVNRVQSEDKTLETIAAARALSDSVNVDLIIGLPSQTPASFTKTLEKIIDTGVTRIAAYNFAYLPNQIKAQRLIAANSLPDIQSRLQLTQITRDIFMDADFVHIGMDHFAAKHDSLSKALKQGTLQRNFQGYTTHKDTDLIGLGVSSISHFPNCYAQNVTEISVYQDRLNQGELPIKQGITLSDDDQLRAALIQQIMCKQKVDMHHKLNRYIETTSRASLSDYFDKEMKKLKPYVEDGLIELKDNHFIITPPGRFFMRQIAAEFDHYLQDKLPSRESSKILNFSRAI